MTIAYVNENQPKTAMILATFLSMQGVQINRKTAGDLVFNDDGSINQSHDWLFDWEKREQDCYAQRMQRLGINLKDYKVTL